MTGYEHQAVDHDASIRAERPDRNGFVDQVTVTITHGEGEPSSITMWAEDFETMAREVRTPRVESMSAPEVTAAVQRLAEAQFRAYESEYRTDGMTVADFYPTAKAEIAVVLDVEEMARVIDPSIVEPMRSKLMDAWRQHGLDADLYMADHEARATERATALRAALLGRS